MRSATGWRGFFERCLRRRYPLVGIFLAAMVGLGLGALLGDWWAAWGLSAATLLLGVIFIPQLGTKTLAIAVGCAFAYLQSAGWEFAPGRQLAEILGPEPAVWTIEGRVGSSASSSPDRLVIEIDSIQAISASGEGPAPAAVSTPAVALRGKISLRWQGTPPDYGQRVRVTGRLQPIPPPQNPGEMNYALWQQLRGIWLELHSARESDQQIVAPADGFSILSWAARTRAYIESVLGEGISDQPAAVGILRAMTIGDTSGLSAEQLRDFRYTGTLHLFSVSGLHVGMLAVLLWMGFRLVPLPRPWAIVAIILLLFFYAAVTGLRPASIRAATMAAVVLAGMLLDRPARPMNSLAAAGLAILLLEPGQLFNPGFQLSFLVVTAILLFGVPVQRWLRESCGPDPFLPRALYSPWDQVHAALTKEIGGLAAISLSAWVGSLPLILIYYHIISLSAIPANLVAVPLAFVILATAILSLLSSVLSLGLASIFNHANLLIITLLSGFIASAAQWPGSYLRVRLPEPFPPPARMVIFDAGSGAAYAWKSGEYRALIDTGSEGFWRSNLESWLDREAVSSIEALVLTHGDAQHVGGARAAIERTSPGWVGLGPLRDRSPSLQSLARWMAEKNEPRRILTMGDQFSFGPESRLHVLYPPPNLQLDLADDKALVLLLESHGWRILLLGDAGWATADWLRKNQPEQLRADFVLLGRHRTGVAPEVNFLETLAPRAIIASNTDFPARESLDPAWRTAISSTGIPLFLLDETGAITLDLTPQRATLRPFHPSVLAKTWDSDAANPP